MLLSCRLLQVVMDGFTNGLSMDVIILNWQRVKELLAKLGIVVPSRVIDGICNFKEGAAELLLEQLYRYLTTRQIRKVKPWHPIDFTDHAYQVPATRNDCTNSYDRSFHNQCNLLIGPVPPVRPHYATISCSSWMSINNVHNSLKLAFNDCIERIEEGRCINCNF